MSTEATGDSKPNATGAIGAAAGTEAAELTATAVDVPAVDELAGDGPAAGALAAPLVDEVPRPAPASDDPALTDALATEDAPAADGALVVEKILTANDGLVTRRARRVGARGLRARRRAGRAGNDLGDGEPAEAVTGSGGDGEAEPAGSAGERGAEPKALEGDDEAEPAGEPEGVETDEANAVSEPGSRTEPDDDDQPDELNDADRPDEVADQFDEAEEPGEGYEVYEEYEEYAEYEVYEPDADADADAEADAEADGDAEAGSGTGPQRGRRWPRVLLGLGFVVLAAAIVGGAVAIVGSLTHGFKKPVKITYRSSPVFSLKTGDCFNPRGQQAYTLIACDSPHQAEVFATFALAGASWPGNAVVQAKASDGCASRLTEYVNPQLAISLSSTYVYPDTIAWQAGTRTVICEVRATSGELTGSVRGSTASSG